VWTAFARPTGSTGTPHVPKETSLPHANGVYTLDARPRDPRRGVGCFGSFMIGLLALVAIAVTVSVVGSLNPANPDSSKTVAPPALPVTPQLSVLYEVVGSAGSVSLTYSTATGTEQHDVRLPVMNTSGPAGIGHKGKPGESLYIAAQNRGESGTVSCRIMLGVDK
jgi:hypothetical protein